MVHISLLFIRNNGSSSAVTNIPNAQQAGEFLYKYLGGPDARAGACVGWMGCSTQSQAFEISKCPTWTEQDFADHIALLLGYNLGWNGSRFMTQNEHDMYKAFQDKLWKKRNPWYTGK